METQQAQMEAEQAQMETQMRASEEKQKLEMENSKLKLEAQAGKQEVKAQQDALKAQQEVAKHESAKTKAEQALQGEKAKSVSQGEQLKVIQQKAQLAESQAKAQADFATQQAKLQGEQAKAEQQAAATREQLSQQQTQMSQQALQEETKLNQMATQQQTELAQHDAQQTAQQAQQQAQQQTQQITQQAQQEITGAKQEAQQTSQQAQLGAQQESLGMQEKSLTDKLQGAQSNPMGSASAGLGGKPTADPMSAPGGMPPPHPSISKIAMYVRRHSGGNASQAFFKSSTVDKALGPKTLTEQDYLSSSYKGKANGLQDWAKDIRKQHGDNVQFSGNNSNILQKHYGQAGQPAPAAPGGFWNSASKTLGYSDAEDMGQDYDKWLAHGTGTPWESRFWDKANRSNTWYGKLGGGLQDIGEGVGSFITRDPMRAWQSASEDFQKGKYIRGVGKQLLGTGHGVFNLATFGLGGGAAKGTAAAAKGTAAAAKGSKGLQSGKGILGQVGLGFISPSVEADSRVAEKALREVDQMNAALEQTQRDLEAKQQAALDATEPKWDGNTDAQAFNRMSVNRRRNPMYDGMPADYQPNPILELVMNWFSDWATGGGKNQMLAQRDIQPSYSTVNPTDELVSYVNRVRTPEQYDS
jgi:hypothetical protein